MSAKQRPRIYSQEPNYSTQNRQKKSNAKDIVLIRAPSFQDEQLFPQRHTSKMAQIAKTGEKYELALKETQSHKSSMQDNLNNDNLQQPPKKIS